MRSSRTPRQQRIVPSVVSGTYLTVAALQTATVLGVWSIPSPQTVGSNNPYCCSTARFVNVKAHNLSARPASWKATMVYRWVSDTYEVVVPLLVQRARPLAAPRPPPRPPSRWALACPLTPATPCAPRRRDWQQQQHPAVYKNNEGGECSVLKLVHSATNGTARNWPLESVGVK